MMDEQHQQKRECKKANRQKRQQKFHQQQAGNDMGIITGAHHEDQVPADQVPAVHVTSDETTTDLHAANHNMASASNTQQEQPVNVMDDTTTDLHTGDTMQPQTANHNIASGTNRQQQQVNDSIELCLGVGCRVQVQFRFHESA